MYIPLLAQEQEEPGWFTEAIMDFFMWLIGWLCELVRPLIESLIALFPDSWVAMIDQYLAEFSIYAGAVNQWIALDWAFSLLGIWALFMIVFLAVKILLKLLVPGIG